MMRTTVVVLLMLSTAACRAQQPEKQDLLARVAWLRGCWETTSPPRTLEEWSPPQGGAMIGTSRTFSDGKVAALELVELTQRDNQLAYDAQPAGQPPATFLSTTIADSTVVFENTRHDFPQRIGYRLNSADSLSAWIEGTEKGQQRRIEFPYRRVVCASDKRRSEGPGAPTRTAALRSDRDARP